MAEAATAASGSLIADAAKKLNEHLGAFREVLVTVTALIAAYIALNALFDGFPRWVTPLLVASLLAILYFGYIAPAWRRQNLRVLSKNAGAIGARAFRLTPYEARDSEVFSRPDSAVDEITAWIDADAKPVLYLSGRSGVGKSSLIAAGVAPKLASNWRIAQARPHDNFFEHLGKALVTAFPACEASDVSARARIEAAAASARGAGKRLLLIVDQFEEVFILQDAEMKQAVGALFDDLNRRPIDNLVVLLSLRADFVVNLSGIGMPPPRDRENWREVSAFDLPAAKRFLTDKLTISDALMAEVLKEAAEIEDRADQVRPIILNMYGLVLSLFEGGAPRGIARRRLLNDYVRRVIFASDIRDVAPRLVRGLVTELGTKRTREITELANEAGVPHDVAHGCLVALSRGGLARALDDDGVQWELSHDFVAKLAAPMVQPGARWREQARKWAAPAALTAWLVTVGLGALCLPDVMQGYYRLALERAGFTFSRIGSDGERTASYDPVFATADEREAYESRIDPELAHRFLAAAPYLRNLRPHITTLHISEAPVTSMDYLPSLLQLVSLRIERHPWIRDLAGMPSFPKLEKLEIAHNARLASLSGTPQLPALTSLEVLGNDQLTDLRGLPALPSLTEFSVANGDGPDFGLLGLQDAPQVRRLVISGGTVASFEGLSNDGSELSELVLDGPVIASLSGLSNHSAFVCTIAEPGREEVRASLTDVVAYPPLCHWGCSCQRTARSNAQ